jgi:hypothetical protein
MDKNFILLVYPNSIPMVNRLPIITRHGIRRITGIMGFPNTFDCSTERMARGAKIPGLRIGLGLRLVSNRAGGEGSSAGFPDREYYLLKV